MTVFSGIDEAGEYVFYEDKKRYLWWLGYISFFIVAAPIPLYFWLGQNPWVCLIPLAYTYFITPIVDKFVGEDEHNPPEDVVPEMAEDKYYRWQVIAHIPLGFVLFFAFVWFVGTQSLPWWAIVALIIGVGTASGGMLTLTHELGHKPNKADQLWARFGNVLMGYGHFNIEHNRGHHVWVSTPEDPASARMGESIYRFIQRELPVTIKRGLGHEKRRLAKQGRGFFSIYNHVLQVYAATLTIMIGCVFVFGPVILWFLIPHHMLGWYALTQANYVEHYGLLREKKPNGKYEPCQPHHSWNTNHLWSNMILFHLQRHSDHHANPLRPYQVLRDYPDVPSLPMGYGGCFALAAFPRFWFKVMDKKVMEWAGGDISKVNVCPKKKEHLAKKWGQPTLAE